MNDVIHSVTVVISVSINHFVTLSASYKMLFFWWQKQSVIMWV